jgi:sugar phosphate isomerase/epimerase
MKLSFSTLACPDWTLPQIIAVGSDSGYDGIELRFVENEDSLWRLSALRGTGLAETKKNFADRGLAISCVDTSCRFHFPDPMERKFWLDEGERMSDLAAELGAPGIRVFGDAIQPGADSASTKAWIAECIQELAEKSTSKGVSVWLETHGDFASGKETEAILAQTVASNVGVIWDPANCFLQSGETPSAGAEGLGMQIRHVHLKDMQVDGGKSWRLVLTGKGNFPLAEVLSALRNLKYDGFLSFEWEKKWHPEIADATVALPDFIQWFQENSAR